MSLARQSLLGWHLISLEKDLEADQCHTS